MLKKILLLGFLLAQLLATAQEKRDIDGIPDTPSSIKYVNDYSNTLSAKEKALLENKLENYYDSTSTEIVIVVEQYIRWGLTIEDYANKLGHKWGIGDKEKNNGIVIVLNLSRREIRIETGYGIEKKLPDVTCMRIIDEIMIPEFKVGNYYTGLNKGLDRIFFVLSGKYKPDTSGAYEEILWWHTYGAILILISLFTLLISPITLFIAWRRTVRDQEAYEEFFEQFLPDPILKPTRKRRRFLDLYHHNSDPEVVYVNRGGGGGYSSKGGGGGSYSKPKRSKFGGGSFGGGGATGRW